MSHTMLKNLPPLKGGARKGEGTATAEQAAHLLRMLTAITTDRFADTGEPVLPLGGKRGMSAHDLALRCVMSERQVRACVMALRDAGEPICGTPESGYFIAQTPEELAETLNFIYARAMASLRQWGRMKRVSLPELLGQLKIDFEQCGENMKANGYEGEPCRDQPRPYVEPKLFLPAPDPLTPQH